MTDQITKLTAALADRYTIEREVGAGGMATVYLAEDVRHHRKVALKVLRPDLAATLGPERFVREIEVAAQLHHPHILPLYDSGDAAGFLFFVMPYEEGQSLRERLDRENELPIRDVIRLLHDVADALSHAHEHGLVHRDIKPENVMLSGRHALVTDFGVAKAVSEATGRQQLTTMGVALGTPAYMAPEQASADPKIDGRADIYALGILAYELLTGQPPFSGNTPQAILAAQVSQLPRPVQEHRPSVSPELAMLVMKCLEKKPADRFQSAEELLPLLESMATPSGGTTPLGTAPYQTVASKIPNKMPYAVAAAALIAAAAWVGLRGGGEPNLAISLDKPTRVTRNREPEKHVVISPDGRWVAFQAGNTNNTQIVVQEVAGGDPLKLTEDWQGFQTGPQWGPDGQTVLFAHTGGQDHAAGVWRLPRTGGQGTRLEDQLGDRSLNSGFKIETRGDTAFALDQEGEETVLRVGMVDTHSMIWRPDSGALAYVVGNSQWLFGNGNVAPSEIWVVPMGGSPVRVAEASSMNLSPAWLPDGTLLFISDRDGARDIFAVALDNKGRPRGDPQRMTTVLEPYSISLSADGTKIAYDRFVIRHNIHVLALPTTGVASIRDATQLTFGTQQVEDVDLSLDGEEMVFDSDLKGGHDIFTMSAEGGSEPRQITSLPGGEFAAGFSPDRNEIVFHAIEAGTREIMIINADGTGIRPLTDDSTQEVFNPAMSSDGLHIAYATNPKVLGVDSLAGVYVLSRADRDGEWGAPELVVSGGFFPTWSPVSPKMMTFSARYSSGEDGVWVLDGDGPVRTVTSSGWDGLQGHRGPTWSDDGRSIYFVATNTNDETGFYRVAAVGGDPTLVVAFDEPSMPVRSNMPAVRRGKLYLTISEISSNIWVADLVRQ